MTSSTTFHGKWSQPGVPQKGWTCEYTDDLGSPSLICEMCETTEIRYIHYMSHAEYPGILGVGCICAEHMEDDYVRPRERERKLKSSARRRKNWSSRRWRQARAGIYYLNTGGFRLTVFERAEDRAAFWVIVIKNRRTQKMQSGKKRFRTAAEAKSSAFEALLWAESHLK